MDKVTERSSEFEITPVETAKEVIKPVVETISEGLSENLRPGYLNKEILEAVDNCGRSKVGIISGPLSNDSKVGHGFQLTFEGGYLEYSLFRDARFIEPLIIRKGISVEGLRNRMNAMSCCATGDKCTRTSGGDCLSDTGADDPCPSASTSSGIYRNPDEWLNEREIDDIVDLLTNGLTLPPIGGNEPAPDIDFNWCEEVRKRFVAKSGEFPFCDFSGGHPPSAYHAYIKHDSGVTSLIRIVTGDSLPQIDKEDGDLYENFNHQFLVDIHEEKNGTRFLSLRPSK